MSLSIDAGSVASTYFQRTAPIAQEPAPTPRASIADGIARLLGIPRPDSGGAEGTSGERQLVASEDSVTAGGKRDAYDLRLYREPDGRMTLEMEMTIEFSFENGADGLNWTPQEKQAFMDDYVRQVEASWSGRSFTTDDGQPVTLDVNLTVREQESGFMGSVRDMLDGSEHYNINVLRIPEGGFHRSSVGPGNVSHLDSEDNTPVNKGADTPQVGTVHEFGHMIGLPDEYAEADPGGAHNDDRSSIMNSGMQVRERHLDIVETWVEHND